MEQSKQNVLISLRGIVVIIVCISHLKINSHLWDFEFLKHHWWIQLFYVSTGFLITFIYNEKVYDYKSFKIFVINRFSRVYPVHILIIASLVIIEILSYNLINEFSLQNRDPFTQNKSILSLISNLFLVQGLGFHTNYTWNTVSHPVSAEFFGCIILGFFLLIKKFNNLFYIISIFILVTIINFELIDYKFYTILSASLGVLTGSAACRVFLFLQKNNNLENEFTWNILELFGLTLFLLLCTQLFYNEKFFFIDGKIFQNLFLFLILIIFAFQRGLISKILEINILVSLGKLTFTIYLLHSFLFTNITYLLLFLEKKVLDYSFFKYDSNTDYYLGINKLYGDLSLFLIITLIIVVAYLINTYYEEPIKKIIRKKLK